MMINRNIDIEKLTAEYKEKRRVQIIDFLEPEVAEHIYNGFQDLTARNLWFQINYGDPKFYDKKLKGDEALYAHFTYKFEKYPLVNFKLSSLLNYDGRRKDFDSRRQDAAKIQLLEDHPENELSEFHPLRKISALFNSRQSHDFITMMTGHKVSYDSIICFASRFSAGDYQGAHSDGGHPRKVAFILNMTKDWLPHWGGNLVMMDENYEKVIEDFMPRFNSIVFFDVPIAHAVLPVSLYCQSDRYALTGWYLDLES
jgi:hypothetical protein